MKFQIIIEVDRKLYRMQVEQIEYGKPLERFKVLGKSRYIILQSNRPLLKSKGLKHRRIDWKLIEGEITYKSTLDKIIEAIEMCMAKFSKG